MAGLCVTDPSDPFYITRFDVVEQDASAAYVKFRNAALLSYYAKCGEEKVLQPRIWAHTHPSYSSEPSGTDEKTFREYFEHMEWSIMLIMAKQGSTYARLRLRTTNDMEYGLDGPIFMDQKLAVVFEELSDWIVGPDKLPSLEAIASGKVDMEELSGLQDDVAIQWEMLKEFNEELVRRTAEWDHELENLIHPIKCHPISTEHHSRVVRGVGVGVGRGGTGGDRAAEVAGRLMGGLTPLGQARRQAEQARKKISQWDGQGYPAIYHNGYRLVFGGYNCVTLEPVPFAWARCGLEWAEQQGIADAKCGWATHLASQAKEIAVRPKSTSRASKGDFMPSAYVFNLEDVVTRRFSQTEGVVKELASDSSMVGVVGLSAVHWSSMTYIHMDDLEARLQRRWFPESIPSSLWTILRQSMPSVHANSESSPGIIPVDVRTFPADPGDGEGVETDDPDMSPFGVTWDQLTTVLGLDGDELEICRCMDTKALGEFIDARQDAIKHALAEGNGSAAGHPAMLW